MATKETILRDIRQVENALLEKFSEWHDNGRWMRSQLTAVTVAYGMLYDKIAEKLEADE